MDFDVMTTCHQRRMSALQRVGSGWSRSMLLSLPFASLAAQEHRGVQEGANILSVNVRPVGEC